MTHEQIESQRKLSPSGIPVPITIHDLAANLGCSEKTIRRKQVAYGLKRIEGKGIKILYEMPSPEDMANISAMLAYPFRRETRQKLTRIPNPQIVVSKIEAVVGTVDPATLQRVILTLASLLNVAIRCCDPDMTIQLNARRLGSLVGNNHAATTIQLLMKSGLIHRVHGYDTGKQCFGYRLDSTCIKECKLVMLPWPGKLIAESSKQAFLDPRTNLVHSPEVISRLEEDLAKISLSEELDVEAIASHRAVTKLKELQGSRKRHKKGQMDDISRAEFSRICVIDAARRFRDEPRKLKPKDRSWRVFHAVANMQRALRSHLQFDGQPMCSIDIRCSQPYLLGLLFKSLEESYRLAPEEIEDFMNLTQSGKFYEWLQTEASMQSMTRDRFKECVFRDLLFGKNYCSKTKVFKAFARRFPSLGVGLIHLHGGEENLALRLQRMEAEMMYCQILPAVQAALPNHPIITIHDAIMVPESVAETAKEAFESSFPSSILPPPTIIIQHINQTNNPTHPNQSEPIHVPASVQVRGIIAALI